MKLPPLAHALQVGETIWQNVGEGLQPLALEASLVGIDSYQCHGPEVNHMSRPRDRQVPHSNSSYLTSVQSLTKV